MNVKVSPKFQVVIPQEVRQALGLKAGSQVDVIAKGRVAYIVPVVDLKALQLHLAKGLDHRQVRDKKDRL